MDTQQKPPADMVEWETKHKVEFSGSLSNIGLLKLNTLCHKYGLPFIDPYASLEYQVSTGDYKGNFATRYANWLFKMHGIKLDPTVKSQVGALYKANTTSGSKFEFDFTLKLNWSAGDFGDRGSCFWGSNRHMRKNLQNAGVGAVRFFKIGSDFTTGSARAWLFVNYPGKGQVTLCNDYGMDLHKQASVLARLWGCQFIETDLYTANEDDFYANSSGAAVLFDATCKFVEHRVTVSMSQLMRKHRAAGNIVSDADDDDLQCTECGDHIVPDNAYHGPDGDWYCENCYFNNFDTCEHCNETVPAGRINIVDVRNPNGRVEQMVLCDTCLNDDFETCNNCDNYVRSRDAMHTNDGAAWCEPCFDEMCGTCEHCSESFVDHELRQVRIAHNDFETWCDECCDDNGVTDCVRCHYDVVGEHLVKRSDGDVCQFCINKVGSRCDGCGTVVEHWHTLPSGLCKTCAGEPMLDIVQTDNQPLMFTCYAFENNKVIVLWHRDED